MAAHSRCGSASTGRGKSRERGAFAEEQIGFASSFGRGSEGIMEWLRAHGASTETGVAVAVRLEPWARRGRDFEADRYCSSGPGSILTAELIFQYSNRLQSLKFKMKMF
jgi:hypothetical protein